MERKSRTVKLWITIILLLSSIVLSFAIPKGIKYGGTNFISQLELPKIMDGWDGEDVSSKLDVDLNDKQYSFLNEFLAYQYVRKNGENLLLILLDAGNFHFPNRCLTMAGYQVKELNKTTLNASGRTLSAHTLYAERVKEQKKYLILYWIVIDKKPVPNWVEQKIKQLFFSLFNKKRVGLMARLDIPIYNDNIENGLILAKQFIDNLSQTLPTERVDYIFGEHN